MAIMIRLNSAQTSVLSTPRLNPKGGIWRCKEPLTQAELDRGRKWSRNLNPNFCLGRDLNPEPLYGESCTLTTRPLHTRSC